MEENNYEIREIVGDSLDCVVALASAYVFVLMSTEMVRNLSGLERLFA